MDVESFKTFDISEIPLPNEVPQPLDLKALPESVLKSSALEALISQNEDLMTRLSVSLRRINIIEAELHDKDVKELEMEQEFESLQDQMLVLKEKARILQEKKDHNENEFQSLRNENGVIKQHFDEQIRRVEIEAAEIYSHSQSVQKAFQQKVEKLISEVKSRKKHARKLSQIAHQMRNHLDQNKSVIGSLESQLVDRDRRLIELRARLEESLTHIQDQAKQNSENQNRLIEKYEKKTQSLEADLATLRGIKFEFDELFVRHTNMVNDHVVLNRRFDDYKNVTGTELSQLQEKLTEFRSQNKSQTLEIEANHQKISSLSFETQSLKIENQRQVEQIENLQLLWKESQTKLEGREEQVQALQKLNQSLSLSMNQYRREIKELKAQLEQTSMPAPATLPQREEASALGPEIKKDAERIPSDFSPELMNRIDSLITEIQTGHIPSDVRDL